MLDYATKFRYFYNILREVYLIIDINFDIDMDGQDCDKLAEIIRRHIQTYSDTNTKLKIGMEYDNDVVTLFLSDYLKDRGFRKIFQDSIDLRSMVRQNLLDKILDITEKLEKDNK